MLAYRHAFHAGNHADVLKHLVLMLVLRHMNAKDKAYRFVDTHGGAGGYSLLGRYAQEERRVRARHRPALDPRRPAGAARRLRRAGARLQSRRRARAVPRLAGAGADAAAPAGRAARLRAAPDRAEDPARHPGRQRRARRSTTATASSACAPRCRRRSRRAAVLIDPSYEGNGDYAKVVATLREALARFADGHLRGLVSAGEQARGGAAAAAARGAGAEGLAARPPVACRSPTRRASAWPAAASSSSTRRTRCTRRWQSTLPYLVDVLGRYRRRQLPDRSRRRLTRISAAPEAGAAASCAMRSRAVHAGGGSRLRSRKAANSQVRMPTSKV